MVGPAGSFADESRRVGARGSGTAGQASAARRASPASAARGRLTDNVNFMASTSRARLRNIRPRVTTAVANERLSQKIRWDVKGEAFEAQAGNINRLVDHSCAPSADGGSRRVAGATVGTGGSALGGGQAEGLRDVSGPVAAT